MTAFEQLFGEDRIRTAILDHLPTGRSSGGTLRFNCPMCVQRGESADQRMRGGIATSTVAISCFNCGFRSKFTPGERLSAGLKAFLAAIGISSVEIARLQYWAATLHAIVEDRPEALETLTSTPQFAARPLPDGARPLSDWVADHCTDPDFFAAVTYLYGRGTTIAEATRYYWTPNRWHQLNQRIIIPCYDASGLVGWTARRVNETISPKYHNATPRHLLFNVQALNKPRRRIVILLEGVFDALALDAVGLLGNTLSKRQIGWINAAGKEIIVLPDRDKAGGWLIDTALDQGWSCAFPRPLSIAADRGWWADDIKDAAAATQHYGQLYTLRSVLATATANRLEISARRQDFRYA